LIEVEKEPPPAQSQAAAPPPAENPPANRGTLNEVKRAMEVVTPTPPDQVTITTPIHLELVRVPAGEFLMGSDPAKDKNARKNEQPQHRVYLSEFYIGKYPITNEQYAVFVKATKYNPPSYWKNGKIPSGEENHPVVYVL
jgi:formylglycine-generating enzyme required for sulfatase activity